MNVQRAFEIVNAVLNSRAAKIREELDLLRAESIKLQLMKLELTEVIIAVPLDSIDWDGAI